MSKVYSFNADKISNFLSEDALTIDIVPTSLWERDMLTEVEQNEGVPENVSVVTTAKKLKNALKESNGFVPVDLDVDGAIIKSYIPLTEIVAISV